MPKTQEPRVVTEGEWVVVKLGRDDVRNEPVGPKCESNAGRWGCADCGQAFASNWAMWSAPCYKRHRIMWVCFEHGPEVP